MSSLDIPARRIRARFLVVDPWTIIEDGWITVTGTGVVRALGSVKANADKEGGYFDEEVDGVVAAAMVNAHCHAEFGAQAGKAPGAGDGLPGWVGRLLRIVADTSPDQRLGGMQRAAETLVKSGVGWVADINNSADSGPILEAAGLRGLVFHEIYDPAPRNAEELISQARSNTQHHSRAFESRVVPHTPHTCSKDMLLRLLKDAQEHAPISIHLAEGPAEIAFLTEAAGPWADRLPGIGWSPAIGVPGKRPIPWFDELGLLGPGLLAVHLVQATTDEAQLLADRRVRTVLCPSSNLHILDQLPNIGAMLEAGLQPGLGTDSPASHPDLNLRTDTKLISERFESVDTATLWAMATRWGAGALALDAAAGSLWPGRAPGLVALDCDPTEDPLQVLTREPERPLRRLVAPGPPPEEEQ